MLTLLFEEKCILTWRGEIGVCGIVVLNKFLRYLSYFTLEMWYCIFPRTCGFLVFWTVLEIILHVLQSCPNLFQFPIGHSQ